MAPRSCLRRGRTSVPSPRSWPQHAARRNAAHTPRATCWRRLASTRRQARGADVPDWSDTAPVADVPCPLGCADGERRRIVDTVWEAPEAAVYKCTNCEIVFIHPIMSEDEERSFYESDFAGYMKDRGAPGETLPEEHFEENWPEAKRRAA